MLLRAIGISHCCWSLLAQNELNKKIICDFICELIVCQWDFPGFTLGRKCQNNSNCACFCPLPMSFRLSLLTALFFVLHVQILSGDIISDSVFLMIMSYSGIFVATSGMRTYKNIVQNA